MNYDNYMDDCIHLKACRRYSKIVKSKEKKCISRGCDDSCSAYETIEDIIDPVVDEYVEAAAGVVDRILSDARSGYSVDDLCVESRGFLREAFEGIGNE